MFEGFWTVVFQASTDVGAGVVSIKGDRIVGGDSAFKYIGTLNEEGDSSVSGEINVSRHSNQLPSVIPGLDNYTLIVAGSAVGNDFTLNGTVKDHPGVALAIKGKKVPT